MGQHKTLGLLVISLWADDVAGTAHFYRDALGLEMLPHHGDRPTFALGGGAHLVICQGDSGPDRSAQEGRWPLMALKVVDLDATVEQLGGLGVEFPWGIERGVGARYVMLRDPAGNLIELAELGV